MAYGSREARQEMLDTIAKAINEIARALAALEAAYEQLDEGAADNLEAELFRPVQVAYGRGKRTYTEFAARYGMPKRFFRPANTPTVGAHQAIDMALDAITATDTMLAELQDSMRPVEVGDPELRAGLAEVRRVLGELPTRARKLERTLGR